MWAYWCGNCASKPVKLNELKEKINNSNFEMVFVSMDKDKAQWRSYIKRNNWDGHHILIPEIIDNPLAKIIYEPKVEDGETTYWVSASTFFLINKTGFGKKIKNADSNKELEYAIKKAL